MSRLVLSRRVGESIVLALPDGREVKITLLERDRNQGKVRLALEAPKDVTIFRDELREYFTRPSPGGPENGRP